MPTLTELQSTDPGRRDGWWIELDGRRVGVLVDPLPADMFWESYRLEALGGDGAPAAELGLIDNRRDCRFQFRSRALGELAAYGIHAPGDVCPEVGGRVLMRGLYLPEPPAPKGKGLFGRLLGALGRLVGR